MVHDAETCASLLLWSQANPNAVDHTPARNAPLVLAAVYSDEVFSSLLPARGADALYQNTYKQSAVTFAPEGTIVAMCLDYCFGRVRSSTILQRNLSTLVAFGCPNSLWNVSKAFHIENDCWDIEGGSHGSTVSFVSPCTGQGICEFGIGEHCTVLSIKQRSAHHTEHLPFAVRLFVKNEMVPLANTWSSIGSPRVMRVILLPIITECDADLSTQYNSKCMKK